ALSMESMGCKVVPGVWAMLPRRGASTSRARGTVPTRSRYGLPRRRHIDRFGCAASAHRSAAPSHATPAHAPGEGAVVLEAAAPRRAALTRLLGRVECARERPLPRAGAEPLVLQALRGRDRAVRRVGGVRSMALARAAVRARGGCLSVCVRPIVSG